jgi:hypothetical protein
MINILGVIGAAIVLLCFIMVELNKWSPKSFSYNILNFTGSVLLVVYAWDGRSYPFIALNLVWAGFSLVGMVKRGD